MFGADDGRLEARSSFYFGHVLGDAQLGRRGTVFGLVSGRDDRLLAGRPSKPDRGGDALSAAAHQTQAHPFDRRRHQVRPDPGTPGDAGRDPSVHVRAEMSVRRDLGQGESGQQRERLRQPHTRDRRQREEAEKERQQERLLVETAEHQRATAEYRWGVSTEDEYLLIGRSVGSSPAAVGVRLVLQNGVLPRRLLLVPSFKIRRGSIRPSVECGQYSALHTFLARTAIVSGII
ncbi:hypothetical protein LSH36_355g04009 [Paralvinella palmiformis]|uniref:Uncharacterized protein n=1 Tax=Paralvinella palmiformis TaxID=53620 RepID=A0AAD9JEY1_9ANNE|nr:hypothetical protein LSH36_355g04009 [Paralvinella palmiformis]